MSIFGLEHNTLQRVHSHWDSVELPLVTILRSTITALLSRLSHCFEVHNQSCLPSPAVLTVCVHNAICPCYQAGSTSRISVQAVNLKGFSLAGPAQESGPGKHRSVSKLVGYAFLCMREVLALELEVHFQGLQPQSQGTHHFLAQVRTLCYYY